jgi:exopolyphosphatase / guanosine-5'-triphosphate,3'-diphosphate pyrophosphatase
VSCRVAAVDIGTNSTRLLVADVEAGRLSEVERLLTITRLGHEVDRTGQLHESATGRVHDTLSRYARRAQTLGAELTLAIATSAVRDAADGRDFLDEVERLYGFRTRLLSGAEEARMMLRGVASARELQAETLVCDIGGGSTELILGGPQGVEWETSLDIGCVRLSERFLRDDPPRREQLQGLRRQVAELLPAGLRPAELVGVAGTVTTLATIDLGLAEEVPERIDGHRLTASTVEDELRRLAAMPLAGRRHVRGLMPERASTIVAGAGILAELMRAVHVDALTVSERDILHGAALEAADSGC